MLVLVSNSPDETREFGTRLGEKLKGNAVISLDGDLGAGKTHFIQGLAKGVGVRERVVSPTFTIISEYDGDTPLVHMDLYRLEDLPDLEDLGLEEYFYDDVITAIEWGMRAKELLPKEFLSIHITHPEGSDKDNRLISMEPVGARYAKLVEELNRELEEYVYSRN